MLTQEVVDEIKRLLTEDELSQRNIALKVGVARGTVSAIANSKIDKCHRLSADESREIYDYDRRRRKHDFQWSKGRAETCSRCCKQGVLHGGVCVRCRAVEYAKANGIAVVEPESSPRAGHRPAITRICDMGESLEMGRCWQALRT